MSASGPPARSGSPTPEPGSRPRTQPHPPPSPTAEKEPTPTPATATAPAAEPGASARAEYRIEGLAHASGATVRTIRAYQDRGLLPRPERRGRANVYDGTHLARLRQIAGLLNRGYTLAAIKELLEAWDTGRGLSGVLGPVDGSHGPWTDGEAAGISRADLYERFGGSPDDEAIAEAVELGVLERVPGRDDMFLVPSPQELSMTAELYVAGVPLPAISGQIRELRGQVEHIAARFLEFTTEHVFARALGHRPPTEADAAEAAALVHRMRPLARQSVDAELARAMRMFATRPQHHPAAGTPPPPAPETSSVALPADTIRAVRRLVGRENTAAFITAATERELQARALDALASTHRQSNHIDQIG
ncbi:MerR family transcriptional regulator [Streptomyces lushanensis]|uniref:MerR family transcriptional regulator n=1 Tax=Streptomyces lushanensis TaxID=1434255 RepID=UPI0009A09D2E|nr:MerR family transcriptional regulator [Streptomyces lushanensis]